MKKIIFAFCVVNALLFCLNGLNLQANLPKNNNPANNNLKNENLASENLEFTISIKNHQFIPNLVTVPANKAFKLIVKNEDKTIEEFESDDLKKEKIIYGNKEAIFNISSLNVGEYKFYGDFHQKTAQGKIVAVANYNAKK
jgi:hypothetical protein